MSEQNGLPKHWRTVTFGEVCAKALVVKKSEKHPDEEFLYLDIGGIDNKTNRITSHKTYQWKEAPSRAQQIVFKGDVLFSTVRTYLKNIAFVESKLYDGQIASSGFTVLRAKTEIAEPRFLFYYSISNQFLQPLNELQTGSSYPAVRDKDVFSQLLPLPPLAEQQRIVAKLEEVFSELDAGLASLKTAAQQLKTYRQAVLKWAFEGKLTNSANAIGSRTFGEIVKVVSGNTPKGLEAVSNSGTVPFYKVSDMNLEGNEVEMRGSKIHLTEAEIKALKIKIFPKGTVIFPKRGGAILTNKKRVLSTDSSFDLNLMGALPNENIGSKYLYYWFQKLDLGKIYDGSNVPQINNKNIEPLEFPLCSLEEQHRIVQEIESRLSVCDKLEETITAARKQAEALRQSILKQAFEGKLLRQEVEMPKPDKLPFYQMRLLGLIVYLSLKYKIRHGEMTLAKYTYLLDRIYGVRTYYNFGRGNLGPFSGGIKKTIHNPTYFKSASDGIQLQKAEQLLKYSLPQQSQIEMAVDELAGIFLSFDDKERPRKTELLATACKVIEDLQSLDLSAVRQSMTEWKIDLKNTAYKNKAQKFTEEETKKCLAFVVQKGWDKKLIKPV